MIVGRVLFYLFLGVVFSFFSIFFFFAFNLYCYSMVTKKCGAWGAHGELDHISLYMKEIAVNYEQQIEQSMLIYFNYFECFFLLIQLANLSIIQRAVQCDNSQLVTLLCLYGHGHVFDLINFYNLMVNLMVFSTSWQCSNNLLGLKDFHMY